MTSSQTKEGDTIASFLGSALRDAGHDVTVGRPSLRHALGEDLGGDHEPNGDLETGEAWDWVFVGLGPLHGLGTAYKYGALGTIGRYWDRCTLYLDDVDSGKIGGGIRTMLNVKGKLTRPFFGYCKEWPLASQPDVTRYLLDVVEALRDVDVKQYPRMIVPAFTLDEGFRVAARVSASAGPNVVPIDLTTYAAEAMPMTLMAKQKYGDEWLPKLEEALRELSPSIGIEDWWATDMDPHSSKVRSYGPFQWRQLRVSRSPALSLLSSGYISPTEQWSPRFAQLSSAGIPIVTAWQIFAKEIGDAYEVLASTIEMMDLGDRRALARSQYEQLQTFSPSKESLAKKVDSLMEEP